MTISHPLALELKCCHKRNLCYHRKPENLVFLIALANAMKASFFPQLLSLNILVFANLTGIKLKLA